MRIRIFIYLILLLNIANTAYSNPEKIVIKLGVYDNYPKIFSNEDGEPDGIFIDIFKAIAEKENFETEYIIADWTDLHQMLKDGKLDVLADVAYSEERDSVFILNKLPLLESWLEAFTLKDAHFVSIMDFKDKKIGVLRSSIQEQYLQEYVKPTFGINFEIITYSTYRDKLKALKNGETDLIVADRFFYYSPLMDENILPTAVILRTTGLHFAFNKETGAELAGIFDKNISEMKNSANSEYYKSLQKWLNKSPKTLVPAYIWVIVYISIALLILILIFTLILRQRVKARTQELALKNQELSDTNQKLKGINEELNTTKNSFEKQADFINDIMQTIPAGLYRLIIKPGVGLNSLGLPEFETEFYNKAMENMLDISIQDVRENQELFFSRIHKDELENFLIRNMEAVEKMKNFEWEGRLVSRGKTWWGRFDSSPKTLDDNNILWTGILQDITDRKNMEIELVKSEKLFQTLAEISPVGIFRTNSKGITNYVNPKWCELTGVNTEIALKQEWINAIHPDDIELVMNNWEESIKNSKESVAEYRFLHADGSVKWIYGLATPEIEDGELKGYIGTLTDITSSKETEIILKNKNKELIKAKDKAEESDRLKTAFLSNMSHEIRTPMNGILGFIELMKDNELSEEETGKYINIVEISANRLLNTINDIIEISKIESGEISVHETSTNITELFLHNHDFFFQRAKEKGIQLRIGKMLKDEDAIIITDKYKLEGILTNLLNNAIKFTNKGYIETGCYRESDKIFFYVKDTGTGIPEDRIGKIFDRFVQADLEITRPHEGSGLGLSIVKAYLEIMNGDISVESTPDKGSMFIFSIPAKNTKAEQHKSKPKSLTTKTLSGDKIILIAENDDVSYNLLETILNTGENKLIHVDNGKEAVDIVRNNPEISLVIMDIDMPVMNGIEAVKQIRKFNTKTPIIAQTAYAMANEKKEIIQAGCNDYISKPINRVEFLKLVQKYLT